MKEFSKINENVDGLSGKVAFDVFIDIIYDTDIFFVKHDFLNVGEYSYFFTTEKIKDNYEIINILENKRSLEFAYKTLQTIKKMRLSFYFGVKKKTLFYGFYNEDTQYVYKVGYFSTTSTYLKKLKNPIFKNIKDVLINVDMKKEIFILNIRNDFEDFFNGVESELVVKDEFRLSKKYSVDLFNAEDIDELRMNYTLLVWSRKFSWYRNVYSFVNITNKNIYFYIKLK